MITNSPIYKSFPQLKIIFPVLGKNNILVKWFIHKADKKNQQKKIIHILKRQSDSAPPPVWPE